MIAQLAVLLGVMLAAILVGVPVFLGMALAAAIYGVAFMGKLPPFIVGQTFVQGIDSYSFCAIPFFFLAGEIMNVGGISRRLLRLARALIGHVRGGLSHVNILACMVFSGVSGSAAADASAVGAVLIPAMKSEGYPAGYAAAVTAAASTMGPIIPPSIPLVVFGLVAGTSIGKLFVGGVVPGLLMGAFLLVASYLISRVRRYPAAEWLGFGEIASAAGEAVLALLMPIIVVGGLVGGVATATEIGAVAVVYAVLVSVVVYREATLAQLWAAVRKAAIDSCAILVIAAVVGVFTWIVASLGVGHSLAAWIGGITRDPTMVLAVICVVLLVAGMVLEPVTMLLVLIPLMVPVATAVGIDLTHFGVVVVLATLIGLVTPPVGFLIYLCAAQAEATVASVVRELMPFVLALVLLLAAVVLFPGLVLWLPRLMAA
ncbi:MAG: TRAP transporter large permease [Candidatus Eiseniibacteriota bacterium]